jgi:hypothetical protein
MKSILTKLFLILAVCGGVSCKKFVDIESSPIQIESSKVFEDESTATAAMLGLYNQAINTGLNFFTGGNTLYPALSSDELYITGANAVAEQFFTNTVLPNNSQLGAAFWNLPYKFIYQVNLILDGLQRSNSLSEAFKLKISAEGRCVRAFTYFYLLNHFGGVPLVLSPDYRVSMILPRAGIANIYQSIEEDLLFAKEHLPVEYPTANRARPNKYAAIALLSRVYLYQKMWSKAEAEATLLINSGLYPLLSDHNQVFLIGSAETIWGMARDNGNTNEGTSFIPSSANIKPPYAFTDTLLKRFEPGDKRKINWMKVNMVNGVGYYYPYKYKIRLNTPISEQVVILRSAEIYLIRSEARLELGMTDSARVDLNRIRTRSGLPVLSVTDPNDLRNGIEKERQTELFAEWGHRWMDLKRTNRAVIHLPPLKPFFQPSCQLYPIPENEIQKNVYLVQNPGY